MNGKRVGRGERGGERDKRIVLRITYLLTSPGFYYIPDFVQCITCSHFVCFRSEIITIYTLDLIMYC